MSRYPHNSALEHRLNQTEEEMAELGDRLAPLSEPAGTANAAERLQALREATRELIGAAEHFIWQIGMEGGAVEKLKDAIALADAELNREAE